jgi:hypothetical protein
MEEIFRSSISDHFEQWLTFNDDSQIQKFITKIQDLPDFKVWWNNEGHIYPEWSNLKKNSSLIKIGKHKVLHHP